MKTKIQTQSLDWGESSQGKMEQRNIWQLESHQYLVLEKNQKRSLTMNKFVKCMMLAIVSVVTITVFTACDKEMVNEPALIEQDKVSNSIETDFSFKEEFSEYGLIKYPKGIITIEDFRATGKLLTREEAQELIKTKKLGESPENALVGLLFHGNGNLYTPHEFNSLDLKRDFLQGSDLHKWTVDLKTFQKVTGLKEANADYARNFGEFWLFDPDVKFYETREYKEHLGDKIGNLRSISYSSTEYQDYLKRGNMLYGEWQWWTPAAYTGHTSGIVNSPNFGPACYTGDDALRNVIIVEGMPFVGIVRHSPISSGSVSDWTISNMSKRYVMYTIYEPTEEQRNALQEFQENQVGKNWWFPSTGWEAQAYKEDIDSFYCSKLQWLAYKTVMNLDLDRDGGPWVFPRDILYDDDVSYIAF